MFSLVVCERFSAGKNVSDDDLTRVLGMRWVEDSNIGAAGSGVDDLPDMAADQPTEHLLMEEVVRAVDGNGVDHVGHCEEG